MPKHFNQNQLNALVTILENEGDYKIHLKNLLHIRQVILDTMNQNEEYRKPFKPLFDTIDTFITIMSPTDSSEFIQHNKN